MKLNDEIVIADINDKKHILILDNIENVIDASTINAYDLNGKQYTITLDIIGFNSKIGKAYFEYYLNDKFLPPIYENTNLMINFNCKRNDEISSETLIKMEEYLNINNNELTL